MDADRFDAVARSLFGSHTRRSALVRAAGAVAAAGIAAAGLQAETPPTTAAKKPTCASDETRCKKKCCKPGYICAKGTCVAGQADCADNADACETSTGAICHCAGDHLGLCNRRLQGGVRCSIFLSKTKLNQCLNDADCTGIGFPPGSSCVKDYGATCPLGTDNMLGQCAAPCGTKS